MQRLLRRCPRAIRSNSEFYRTFPGAVAGVTVGDARIAAAAGATVGAASTAGEVGSEWQNMLTGADVLPQSISIACGQSIVPELSNKRRGHQLVVGDRL